MPAWITDDPRLADACELAVKWVGERSPRQAWEECPRGDWLLWWAGRCGVDVIGIGYWCAERARQNALRALSSSPERDAPAACAPITDRTTAAARAAADAAETAELAAIADEVRRRVPFEALGMEG